MAITSTTLTRTAGAAAVAAGLIFIGVQVNHPHLDVESITTTEMAVRSTLKLLMAVLALVGITGMYLRQVKQIGVLGLVGYLVLGLGYLLITSLAYASAFVLPTIADTDPEFVDGVIAASTGNTVTSDIGVLQNVLQVQDLAYLAGGLIFGIALYRARVLARWAAALLAVGGVVTIALSQMPDAFYRLLAFPNGIAMVALGCSLWLSVRSGTSEEPAAAADPQVVTAGAE